jgi:hypothetical protein
MIKRFLSLVFVLGVAAFGLQASQIQYDFSFTANGGSSFSFSLSSTNPRTSGGFIAYPFSLPVSFDAYGSHFDFVNYTAPGYFDLWVADPNDHPVGDVVELLYFLDPAPTSPGNYPTIGGAAVGFHEGTNISGFLYGSGTLTITDSDSVPEPAGAFLALGGLLFVDAVRRSKR